MHFLRHDVESRDKCGAAERNWLYIELLSTKCMSTRSCTSYGSRARALKRGCVLVCAGIGSLHTPKHGGESEEGAQEQ